MAVETNIKTRVVLNHDEWSNYEGKVLKAGEVALVKVGTAQAAGSVSEPIWMMKVGDGSKTVQQLPWLVAPAADVYEWAKKSSLDPADVPALEIGKITGLQDALNALASEDERIAGLVEGLTTRVGNLETASATHATKAELEAEATARGNEDTRLAGLISGLDTRLTAEESKVDNDTTYTFADGTDGKFTVTPKGGSAQTIETGAKSFTENAIAAEAKLRSDADTELSGRISTLEAIKHEEFATKNELAGKSDNGHKHVAADVTDFESTVTTIVGGMGIASDEVVSDISERLQTAEGEIDDLQTAVTTTLPGQIGAKVDQSAYDQKVIELANADSAEAQAREALAGRVQTLEQTTPTLATKTELQQVDAKFANYVTPAQVDTAIDNKFSPLNIKVEDHIGDTTASLTGLDSRLQTAESSITDLDTAVKAAQADATAAKTAIEAFLDDNAISDGVINTLKEINEQLASGDVNAETLAGDIQLNKEAIEAEAEARETADTGLSTAISNEVTAREEADADLQDQIDAVKETADSAVKSVTADGATGLTVETTNGVATIKLIQDVVFVLDGGTAADLTATA